MVAPGSSVVTPKVILVESSEQPVPNSTWTSRFGKETFFTSSRFTVFIPQLLHYSMKLPPFTFNVSPVMKPVASLARNRTAPATS